MDGILMEAVQGMSVIHNPTFNKGSAFTEEERKNFKLHGLVPPNTQTLEEQVHRAYEQYSSRADDLAKNTFMASMKMQNEVLYFRVSTIIFLRGSRYLRNILYPCHVRY